MKQRPRIYYTESQKAIMWERWRKGESLHRIAELFDRNHSSIQQILAESGGIEPAQRRLSRLALTLAEREEISRSVATGQARPTKLLGIEDIAPRPVGWPRTERWRTSWPISSNYCGRQNRLLGG
jgi:hypothetical protein